MALTTGSCVAAFAATFFFGEYYSMVRTLFLLALVLPLVSGRGWGQDDIQAVGAVWSDFVASVRRGDYRNAYGLFSPESRALMTFAEFAAEYGPLSASREMVLVKPERQATDLNGDWAEITYGGTNPETGRHFKIGVALVRNAGGWGVVAARSEARERVEAAARGLLRMVWGARDRGTPRELVADLNAAQAKNPVMRQYRIETDGTAVRAFPLEKGLRTFYLDGASGVVRAVGEGEMGPRVLPAEAVRTPERSVLPRAEENKPAALEDGMPALSEPRPRGAGRGAADSLEEEIAEPPMPSSGVKGRARPNLSLPDSIR